MKALSLFAVLLLASSAQAQKLPDSLQARLNARMAASDFQLAVGDAAESMNEREFREKTEAAMKEYQEGEGRAYLAAASGAGVGTGITMTLFSTVHGVNKINGNVTVGNTLAKLLAMSADKPHVMLASFGPGLSLMSGGSALFYATQAKTDDDKVKFLLNNEKANAAAAAIAKDFALMFQLSKEKEATLKYAFLAEMQQKVKNQDQTPIDTYKVLSSANFKGEKVFSEKELSVLEQATRSKIESANPTTAETIHFLLASNAIMKTTLAAGRVKSSDAEARMKKAIAENERVIRETSAYLTANKADNSTEKEKADPDLKSGDAE